MAPFSNKLYVSSTVGFFCLEKKKWTEKTGTSDSMSCFSGSFASLPGVRCDRYSSHFILLICDEREIYVTVMVRL
jgi:hypothetical protein